jgi:hypothetical protein
MKPIPRRTFIDLLIVGTLVVLSNVLFYGVVAFTIFSVLRWMGIL